MRRIKLSSLGEKKKNCALGEYGDRHNLRLYWRIGLLHFFPIFDETVNKSLPPPATDDPSPFKRGKCTENRRVLPIKKVIVY
jgi:hypothetical protein